VTLEERLRVCGAELLIDALGIIESRSYRLVDQDEDKVILAPKLKKEDGLIDWVSSAVDIHNQIRGLLPWPAANTGYRGKMLKIFQSDVLPLFPNHQPVPGEVVRADRDLIIVACGRGFLAIKELQLEAGKRMFAQNFISGHKLTIGEILG